MGKGKKGNPNAASGGGGDGPPGGGQPQQPGGSGNQPKQQQQQQPRQQQQQQPRQQQQQQPRQQQQPNQQQQQHPMQQQQQQPMQQQQHPMQQQPGGSGNQPRQQHQQQPRQQQQQHPKQQQQQQPRQQQQPNQQQQQHPMQQQQQQPMQQQQHPMQQQPGGSGNQPRQQHQQQPRQQQQQQPNQQQQQHPMQQQPGGSGNQPKQQHQQHPMQQQQPKHQQQQPPQQASTSAGSLASVSADMGAMNVNPQPKSRNKYKKTAEPAPAPVVAAAAPEPVHAEGSRPATAPVVTAAIAEAAPKQTRSASVASNVSAASQSSGGSSAVIKSTALIKMPGNKGVGTHGRAIMLDVNYLALNISKLVPFIYHYDVNIEPNMPKRFMPNIFEAFRKANFPRTFIAFDGNKNAFSPVQLNMNDVKERKVMYKDEDEASTRAYMVAIKEVKDTSKIDTKSLQNYQSSRQYDAPARTLQALEVVLKSVFLKVKGVSVGRAFYRPLLENNRTVDLGDYYDLWTGLFQSTVLGSVPYLNVDIAHKAFPRPVPLLDLLRDRRIDPARGVDSRDLEFLRQQLRGLRIRYERPNAPESLKNYKFLDFGDPPSRHMFKDDQQGGKMVSVQQYFQAKYKCVLKFPNLPCVRTSPAEKGVHLPMEFCGIALNQAVMKRCTETQTRNMIRQAATSTDVRRAKIMNLLREIKHNDSPTLQQFGIGVGSDFATVKARVLDPPTLQYAANRTVKPMRGVWNPAGEFLYPTQLKNWAVLILDQRANERAVYEMVGNIVRIGTRSFNMDIDEKPIVTRLNGQRDSDIDQKMKELRDSGCQLLFCIISNFGDAYARVKQAAEIRCGILTQCIKEQTVTRKGNDQSTVSNILLKVNAKLSGTNHKFSDQTKLPVQRRPHMVIGADVTHPSPDQRNIPSVVGVAVSHDANTFCYRMCWRLQDPKQEMIQDLETIIEEQLQLFKGRNKVLPEVLFYYRDGVSDGQFQEVMRVELNAINRGCARAQQGYKPKVVFVVVQKRHHTRFFPKTPNPRDRNNNVEAGTIVDSQITHPNETQFFLVSHASIQGVAKPTKYCLLCDELGMSINDLETLTYNLCHLFTRCNRAVSYPAPTYYAHLAAARGKVYIEGRNPVNMGKLAYEYETRRTHQNIVQKSPMYFV